MMKQIYNLNLIALYLQNNVDLFDLDPDYINVFKNGLEGYSVDVNGLHFLRDVTAKDNYYHRMNGPACIYDEVPFYRFKNKDVDKQDLKRYLEDMIYSLKQELSK